MLGASNFWVSSPHPVPSSVIGFSLSENTCVDCIRVWLIHMHVGNPETFSVRFLPSESEVDWGCHCFDKVDHRLMATIVHLKAVFVWIFNGVFPAEVWKPLCLRLGEGSLDFSIPSSAWKRALGRTQPALRYSVFLVDGVSCLLEANKKTRKWAMSGTFPLAKFTHA